MTSPPEYAIPGRPTGMGRLSQFINYLFWLLYTLLFIRLLLVFFQARGVGFVEFIKTVTDPFYSPFRGIVASPTTDEGYTLAIPILIAIVVYALLHLAITKLLRVLTYRKVGV